MTFLARALTTVAALPAVVLLVRFGGWPMHAVGLVLALVGQKELYRAFAVPRLLQGIGYFFAVAYLAAVFALDRVVWEALVLYALVGAVAAVAGYGRLSLTDIVNSVFGFVYVPFMLAFVALARGLASGHVFVWVIFIACFACDICAYLVGSAWGRRKLSKSPSPSKTVEGLVGGLAGAAVFGFLLFFFGSRLPFFGASESLAPAQSLLLALLSLACAGFAVIGDLFGSAIKRQAGIKDFGSFFPGHGGALDRLDSILLAAPFLYMAAYLFEMAGG